MRVRVRARVRVQGPTILSRVSYGLGHCSGRGKWSAAFPPFLSGAAS
jgi:hypothetical protein